MVKHPNVFVFNGVVKYKWVQKIGKMKVEATF